MFAYIQLQVSDGLTLAGYWVPTKSALLLPFSAEHGREDTTKGSWIEIRAGRNHSAITVMGKSDSTWGKINLLSMKSE